MGARALRSGDSTFNARRFGSMIHVGGPVRQGLDLSASRRLHCMRHGGYIITSRSQGRQGGLAQLDFTIGVVVENLNIKKKES